MGLPVAILIVLAAAAVGFAVVALLRRAVGSALSNPTRGTPMAIVSGTSFSVLLAFLILAAFQTYNGAKTGAATEANAVLDMVRTASLFPASQRDRLRSDLTCYGRATVSHEWPAMGHGQSSPLVDYWVARYRADFGQLSVRSMRDQAAFQDLLNEGAIRTTGRQGRLADSTPAIPTPLWIALLFAGCVAVSLQLGMADRGERLLVQGLQVGGLAAVVAAGLLLITFLDHPYGANAGSLKPSSMQHTLGLVRNIEPSLPPACTATGRPI